MKNLRKPNKLEPGDKIVFLSPSSGLAKMVSHRIKKAKREFEGRGYAVEIYPTAKKKKGFSSDSAKKRAEDLNKAFENNEVKAIISTIGGNTSHQILEFIDFDLIRENPTIFSGFSDITTIHLAFYKISNIVSFYGPAVIPQFGEFPNPHEYTIKYFEKAVTTSKPIGNIEASERWTDDKSADWLEREDIDYKREYKENEGYEWINEGKAEGRILGGCLPSLMHIKGTDYWPDFENKILLLETPEGENFDEGLSLQKVEGFLSDLKILKTLSKVNGIIFGKGFGYTKYQRKRLKEIIKKHTEDFNYPVVYGVNVGHTDPIITVPLGVSCRLNSKENLLHINESGVC